jgi:hypothetical protein
VQLATYGYVLELKEGDPSLTQAQLTQSHPFGQCRGHSQLKMTLLQMLQPGIHMTEKEVTQVRAGELPRELPSLS